MTHDTTDHDAGTTLSDHSAPPLCLVHYFTERGHGPPPAAPKSLGRVAARDGNLIILEFAAPPAPKPKPRRRDTRKAWDMLMLLLLVACAAGCAMAFRF